MQKQFIKGLVTKSEGGKYKVLASTAAIDRQGDSILQSGWDISNFKLNPVMPWAHDYSELPIGKVTSIEVTDRGLEAEFEFAPAEGNPKAQQIKVLYDEGYLNAVSVGFIPKERKGNTIIKAELLEISMVPVPANQEALRLALSKGLDISAIETEIKGAVADELSAEEKWEQKYEKYKSVCEILGAFWNVYFDENTPVEDFDKLLTETIALLGALTGDTTTETEEEVDEEETDSAKALKGAMTAEVTAKFLAFVVEKAGRTLSKATLEKVDAAIDSMKGATSVLEELKKAASSDDQDGNGDTSKEEKAIELPTLKEEILKLGADDLKLYRQKLVADDKSNELSLSLVNALMREKGIKS